MFVRDLSGFYSLPAGRDANEIVLGQYDNPFPPGGPVSLAPYHVWWSSTGINETEVLPETFSLGAAVTMTPEARSTFRVVRAVTEEECGGYLDSMNAYDTALLSAGCYHWTICLFLGTPVRVEEGELAAFFAYLKGLGNGGNTAAATSFHQSFQCFGCDIAETWANNTSRAGTLCWDSTLRKYTATVQLESEEVGLISLTDAALAEWFRGWHWFYRIAMAIRTDATLRARMWDYARLRVRDVLATPWGADAPWGGTLKNGTDPATIGDVFTSEQAAAILVRWHVWKPAHVVNGSTADVLITATLTNALGTYNWPAALRTTRNDTATWTDTEEDLLINALYNAARAVGVAVGQAYDWPQWSATSNPKNYDLDLIAIQADHPGVGLSRARDSFLLDQTNLPPAV
jgi:hypothetical protein